MKVLQINAVNGHSSTGRIVSELAMGLEQRGVESRIAYSAGHADENGYLIGTAGEKKLHAAGSRIFGTQAYFSTAGTRRLLEYIDVESPDVVHLHNLHANYIHLPMLLGYLAEKDLATVVTLHDCWFFTGKCCHYTQDRCYGWETGCGSCPRLPKDNPSWFLDRTAQVWSDKKRLFEQIPRLAVVGVSDWITAEAERSFLSCASIVRRIHNWIDLDTFRPAGVPGPRWIPGSEGRFILLGVASKWSNAKGLADFIRLAAMIEDGAFGPESVAGVPDGAMAPRIVLVGEVDRWVSLPESIGSIPTTTSLGELAAYYASADVLLQLSREETFGMTTAEALACGTPVIAYDATANAEMVGEDCGYLVEPGDLHAVMDHVRQVKSITKGAYSRSCREFAERNFDMNDRIDDLVELYRELRDLKRAR